MPLAAPADWSWVRDLRESRNVDQDRELARKVSASMCRSEDLEFGRFENR